MKFVYFITLFLMFINFSFAQNKVYDMDVSNDITSSFMVIPEGIASFKMVNIDKKLTYKLELKLENLSIEALETPAEFGALSDEITEKIIFKDLLIQKNQKVTINIKVYSNDTIPVLKKENSYIYETERRGHWQTTFGFNFVYLVKPETYFSKNNNDGTFSITESTNRKKFDYFPTLMFTWIPSKDLCKIKDIKFAFSGGIGYDFKKSVSVFLGPSFIYNENITLTFGAAFHNQDKLSSQYNVNDILNENLTFDQLHEGYIRCNPFVSISFRLDKNPF